MLDKVDGRGVISLLNVSDVQQQPAIFSTFMLALLAELYQQLPKLVTLINPSWFSFWMKHTSYSKMPEGIYGPDWAGDSPYPFERCWRIFLYQLTQDVPPLSYHNSVNVHHVIRAFTPNDEPLKKQSKHFRKSEFYDMGDSLHNSEPDEHHHCIKWKGYPNRTVVTTFAPPASMMGPLATNEYESHLTTIRPVQKYQGCWSAVLLKFWKNGWTQRQQEASKSRRKGRLQNRQPVADRRSQLFEKC